MIVNATLGDQIQNIRIANKLTSSEFSEKLGITLNKLNGIEQGLHQADLSLLKLIKILFDLPDDYFHLTDNGTKIKKIRCQNNLSQHEFAKRLGITDTKISEIEQGFQEADSTLLILIKTLFKAPNDFF